MKRITILGSTGSIGRNALEIVSTHRNRFKVVALTAGKNVDLIEEQIEFFSPEIVAIFDEEAAKELRKRMGRRAPSLRILSGHDGVAETACYEGSEFVLSAIVGAAGLVPTIAAIRSGKTIGLANKEALVMAGRIVIEEAKKSGVKIFPVDSEHSAVFQCIEGHRNSEIRRIILTASGGPFAGKDVSEMNNISPEDALRHPNWRMGKKITIDSATLMNKGFEMIEAHYLFNVSPEKIEVLVHPQSIVHSIVEFQDRSCIAQLSLPDMKGPIAYALS
ncbi:MAG: 1-deoxy-D-xylulose-5-phosphate reductoisomerase, partial [Nitrospirae bacterium RBG_13_43_8]